MKKILLAAIAACLIGLPAQARKVRGSVSAEGKPLAGVTVSDGYRFTSTGADGSFSLNTHKDARFVFVITPSGFVADFSSGAPQFYLPVKGTKSFDFQLDRLSESDDYTLFSVSGKEGIGERYILSFQNKDQKSTSVS